MALNIPGPGGGSAPRRRRRRPTPQRPRRPGGSFPGAPGRKPGPYPDGGWTPQYPAPSPNFPGAPGKKPGPYPDGGWTPQYPVPGGPGTQPPYKTTPGGPDWTWTVQPGGGTNPKLPTPGGRLPPVPGGPGGGGPGGGGGGAGGPRFKKWWERRTEGGYPGYGPDFNSDLVRQLARAGWQQGLRGPDLRPLFGAGAENLFASNYAGGQGQPSPYLDFFRQNPDQVGALLQWLQGAGKGYGQAQPYVPGTQPGGAQQALFEQIPGLRGSYLDSIGKVEVQHPGGGTLIMDKNDPQIQSMLMAGGQIVNGTPPPPDPSYAGTAQLMQRQSQYNPLPEGFAPPAGYQNPYWGGGGGFPVPGMQPASQGLGGPPGPPSRLPPQTTPPQATPMPAAQPRPMPMPAPPAPMAPTPGAPGPGAPQPQRPVPSQIPQTPGNFARPFPPQAQGTGQAGAQPNYLAQAQQQIGQGGQGLGVPLTGAYEQGSRALEDQLAQALMSIGVSRDQIGPALELFRQRMATDQGIATGDLNEQMVGRGMYDSGARLGAQRELDTGFGRAGQDATFGAAQQYADLDSAASEAYLDFQQALQELLLSLGQDFAENPTPALGPGTSSGDGSRRRRRRRPRRSGRRRR